MFKQSTCAQSTIRRHGSLHRRARLDRSGATPVVLAAVVAAILTIRPPPGRAAVLKRSSIERLSARSSIIAIGRVKARRARWTRSKRMILTEVTISVTEYLKRPAGQENQRRARVRFLRLGGRVGRIEMRTLGSPRFRVAEEVLVFLTQRRGGLFVTGMAQGKFRIIKAPATGRKMVVRTLAGVRFAGPGRARINEMSLTRLKKRIRSTLALPKPRSAKKRR